MQNCTIYIRYLLLAFVLLMFFASCEKIIEINIQDVDPILVIEAEVGNDRTMQVVTLKRSVNFSSSTTDEPVSGASVIISDERISDDSGYLPTPRRSIVRNDARNFQEVSPGVYVLDSYRGYEGVKYTLRIILPDGQEYEASSVMPQLVKIDSIGSVKSSVLGEDRNLVAVKYQDPEEIANYYRYRLVRNNQSMNTILVRNDKYTDGRMVEQSLFDMDIEFENGDHVEVVQQSISKEVYDFFDAIVSNNPGTAAPANPPTMFGTGTIGYFSAYSADRASVVIFAR